MKQVQNIPESSVPVWNTLLSALKEERFPQMLLLDGEAGVGKKLLAMKIAEEICKNNSESISYLIPIDGTAKERETPEKVSAKIFEMIQKIKQNPYRIDIVPQSAIISVDMVQQLLQTFTLTASNVRVTIIANADLMNEQAANKFLKTFEEVPKQTYFILTANSRHKLLKTIRSRVSCFFVPPLSKKEISGVLRNYDYAEPPENVLDFAMGSAGKAMQIVDANFKDMESRTAAFFNHVKNKDASSAFFDIDLWFPTKAKKGEGEPAESATMFLEFLAFSLRKYADLYSSAAMFQIQRTLQLLLAKKISANNALQNLTLKFTQGII